MTLFLVTATDFVDDYKIRGNAAKTKTFMFKTLDAAERKVRKLYRAALREQTNEYADADESKWAQLARGQAAFIAGGSRGLTHKEYVETAEALLEGEFVPVRFLAQIQRVQQSQWEADVSDSSGDFSACEEEEEDA